MTKTIIFDWKRTLYNPETKSLIRGTKPLLNFLKKQGIKLVLIGKGGEHMRVEIKRLGIDGYFSSIIFGDATKTVEQFKPYITERTKDTTIIGDRVRGEIELGNRLGAITIWVKASSFVHELPITPMQVPTHTVHGLLELLSLLQTNA